MFILYYRFLYSHITTEIKPVAVLTCTDFSYCNLAYFKIFTVSICPFPAIGFIFLLCGRTFSSVSTGKGILIDKFWLMQLAFSSDLAMCMALYDGFIQCVF